MAVEIELDIVCPVTDNELYDLRDLLKREVPQLSQVQLQTKPAQPGEMGESLLETIIKATVDGAVSIALEQFYVKVWEPIIGPLITDWWLKKKGLSAVKEHEGPNPRIVFEVSLSDGAESHRFAMDVTGKRYSNDLQSYTINPQKTYALLIGCSEYDEGLPAIPPIKTNLESLHATLTKADGMAVPPAHIVSLLNPDCITIKRALYEISRRASMDTLLIYFAGHGYRAGAKELFLLAKDSNKLSETEYLQAIEYDFIKKRLKEATARQKILILDACHSGLATLSATQPLFEAEGAYILASSQGNEVSYFDPSHRYTYFTGALLEVLQKGVEPVKEKISLNDLYEKTKQLLTAKGFPEPVRCKKMNVHSSHYFLCNNPAFSLELLRDDIKRIKAAGNHEEALYELELLIKRFPEDAELRNMQRTYSPDTLFAKLVEEGDELYYKERSYDAALAKYKKAHGLRNDTGEVLKKIRLCEDAIMALAKPLGAGEVNELKLVIKEEPHKRDKNETHSNVGNKRTVIICTFVIFVIGIALAVQSMFQPPKKTAPEQSRITDTTSSVQKVNDAGENKNDKLLLDKKISQLTPSKDPIPRYTKAQIPEGLNGAVFDSLASSNSLRIYDIQKNTCSMQGRLCAYTVTARLKFDGKTFSTIEGNVRGRFTLYDNNTQIIGTLKIDEYGMPCAFTLTKR